MSEYLARQDQNFRKMNRERGLETLVREEPRFVRDALLRAPEVRKHAASCRTFELVTVHVGGRDIPFSEMEEEQFFRQPSLPLPSQQIPSPPVQDHQTPHSFSSSPSESSPFGVLYGPTVTSMTCTCGQTIVANGDSRQKPSYTSPVPGSSSPSPREASYGTIDSRSFTRRTYSG